MKEIFISLERCVGCKSCELACAVQYSQSKTLFAAVAEKPVPRKRIFVEYGDDKKIPLQCRHCQEAPCIDACISGALTWDKENNLVTQTREKCIGCWMCIMVCPFGAVSRQESLALKCDLCPDREDSFACVEGCPTKALFVGTWEEFKKKLEQEKR